jgi:CheY-specific phosphatase CheX
MKSCFPEVLEEVIRRSADECFRDSGVTLPPLSAPSQLQTDDSHVAGLIDLTGQIEGSLMLVSTFDLIAKMRLSGIAPACLSKSRAGDWILIRDSAGELTNQFVGRMKNRLRGFGIRFNVGTPIALSGLALKGLAHKYGGGRTAAFGRGPDVVRIAIKMMADPPLTSMEPQAESPEMPREGGILLL